MHKFLQRFLFDLKFKCADCLKTFTYGAIKTHKGKGEC